MHASETLLSIAFESKKVTDKHLIAKYDAEFNYRFYTPKSEHEWIDTNVVLGHNYSNSRKRLGTALEPIYVAVNDHDEHIDDPIERVHGRIINGRQRYEDSKITNERWPVVYVNVKNSEEFILIWCSMDSKKSDDVRKKQTTDMIAKYCRLVLEKKPEEICDSSGQPDKTKVGAYVRKQLQGDYPESTLTRYIPQEFKDSVMSEYAKLQGHNKEKKLTKDKKKILELESHVTELMNKINAEGINSKPLDTKTKMILERDKKIKKLKSVIGDVKSEIRKLRKQVYPDETDKEFEQFWERYTEKSELYSE